MFHASVVLNSSGLRLRNPNEAFFCNGVFNANNGKFEPLKPEEYLVSPLFPYTKEPCNSPFKAMLADAFDGDVRKINLLKNAVRFSVTYDSGEAMAVFLYGEGSTGNAKLIEVFEKALENRLEVPKSGFLTGEDSSPSPTRKAPVWSSATKWKDRLRCPIRLQKARFQRFEHL